MTLTSSSGSPLGSPPGLRDPASTQRQAYQQQAGEIPASSLMTPEELARELKVSLSWVREHASGRRHPVLPSINLGTEKHPQYRFDRKVIQEWLNGLAKQ